MSKNIKEIGKELLGKSLNSFHKKTGLIQLEENNKMQDGILNGMLSQVDDAYIEKTEQSNVIHLDGSGDGTVVLDSIEGNTLVNLCKGTNSNNGLLQGNNYYSRMYLNYDIPAEKTVTVIFNVKEYAISGDISVYYSTASDTKYTGIRLNGVGQKKVVVKITEPATAFTVYIHSTDDRTEDKKVLIEDLMILEGDYSNKNVAYFSGLQSSFEESATDEGQYEIEILSQNENLCAFNFTDNTITNKVTLYNDTVSIDGAGIIRTKVIKLKANTSYIFGATVDMRGATTTDTYVGTNVDLYKVKNEDEEFGKWIAGSGLRKTSEIHNITHSFTPETDMFVRICLTTRAGISGKTIFSKIGLHKNINSTYEYIYPKQNKIKLLINEPLRAIDDVRDRLCIKDNKLVVERNVALVVFDENNFIENGYTQSTYRIKLDIKTSNSYGNTNTKKIIKDNNLKYYWSWSLDEEHYYFEKNFVNIFINKERVNTYPSMSEFLKNNNHKFVYELAEPYYEEVLNEYGKPILLEGYENGVLYVDSTIVPTTTVRYTPKMESFNAIKEISNNNTELALDINDSIIPYMMDVDLMIMQKEMALISHKNIRIMEASDMTNMQKRTGEMLARLIKGGTLTKKECKTRITTYLGANKITNEQAEELKLLINEVYA